MELLFNSNCVSSFLEKMECSHAQLIIESRQKMNYYVGGTCTQNKMAIQTYGIFIYFVGTYILDTRYVCVNIIVIDAIPQHHLNIVSP